MRTSWIVPAKQSAHKVPIQTGPACCAAPGTSASLSLSAANSGPLSHGSSTVPWEVRGLKDPAGILSRNKRSALSMASRNRHGRPKPPRAWRECGSVAPCQEQPPRTSDAPGRRPRFGQESSCIDRRADIHNPLVIIQLADRIDFPSGPESSSLSRRRKGSRGGSRSRNHGCP